MQVRLKDIARDLGVSVVTVSKVLRNHQDIGPETRERVLKRIKELNYQPNPAARALVTGKTHLAGLVVPDLVHPFFSQLAKTIARSLRLKGYGLVISSSEEDTELEREEIQQMTARRLDVFLIASTQPSAESFRALDEQQRPYLLLDRRFADFSGSYIGTDDIEVGRIATGHLLANGCRRIAHLGGGETSPAIERLEGYKRALADAGAGIDEKLIVRHSRQDDAADLTGYQAMKDLLRMSPPPDGVFCFNDPMAMGAMRAILDAGLQIPCDVAIVGAGNVQYAPCLRVPLTSVDQQSDSLGAHAAQLALTLATSKQRPEPQQVLLKPQLIIRESSVRR